MTIESEALKTELHKFAQTPVDFGRPLVEGDKNAAAASRADVSPEHAQATAFMNGPLAEMRKQFRTLLACDDAAQFDGFFNHVRAQANAGEPLYKLLLGEQITTA
jgi:hypothetical protein